jgi:hypothetical protein
MQHKIFIATPMYGGMCYGKYMSSIMTLTSLLEQNGISWLFKFIYNDALITRARNFLVHEFLQTDCTHLFFIDGDIEFNAQHVLDMLAANKGIVCGAYPCKNIVWEKIPSLLASGVPSEELHKYVRDYAYNAENIVIGSPGLKEAENAGTGFMLINRKVFDKLSNTVPYYTSTERTLFTSQKIGIFFDTSIDTRYNQYLSEDYHFCKLWRDLGEKVYIAQWVELKHIGTFAFG